MGERDEHVVFKRGGGMEVDASCKEGASQHVQVVNPVDRIYPLERILLCVGRDALTGQTRMLKMRACPLLDPHTGRPGDQAAQFPVSNSSIMPEAVVDAYSALMRISIECTRH